MSRPFPVLPPSRQKKAICEIPIPNSSKRAKDVFNPREYWSWGANILDRNCTPIDTKHDPYYYVYTWCGTGQAGDDDGPANLATFAFPCGITVDELGNMYVADTGNHKIRKITPDGIVSTIAGTGISGFTNGSTSNSRFYFPTGITVNSSGILYVADMGNNVIRKIENGIVSTLAGSGSAGSNDGIGTAASFNTPLDVTVDSSGNIYIADLSNNKIRVSTSAGIVSTFAGTGAYGLLDGSLNACELAFPTSVFYTPRNGTLYISDIGTGSIRTISNENISTLALGLDAPNGISTDLFGTVYVSTQGDFTIKQIGSDKRVYTYAGSGTEGFSDGYASNSRFGLPFKTAYYSNALYVVDNLNNSIRRVSTSEPSVDMIITSSDTPPVYVTGGFPQYIYTIQYSVLGAGGGGGLGKFISGDLNGGGGGGGGSSYISGNIQNVRGNDLIYFSVGKGGAGSYYNASELLVNASDGGDTSFTYSNSTIIGYGGHHGLSGTFKGGNGGSGAYGGGGGWSVICNGQGGNGTIESGTSGISGVSGQGGHGGGWYGYGFGGNDNGLNGKNRGGGGGGHGGGNGIFGNSNAMYYGAGGGGLFNSNAEYSAGNGGDGIISFRFTKTL